MTGNNGNEAVVLSGGGAYGAYEVGVMKALVRGQSPSTGYRPLTPALLSGTSVGAFNASVMTMYPGMDSVSKAVVLEQIWLDEVCGISGARENGVLRFRANPLRYLDPTMTLNPGSFILQPAADAMFLAQYLWGRAPALLRASGSVPLRMLQLMDVSAFVSTEPFQRLIADKIRFAEVRDSEVILRIAATEFESGAVRVFCNEDMTDEAGPQLVMASAAIPGIFPTVQVAGMTYVDGGVTANTPLKYAIDAGATTLHVIYLDPDVRNVSLRPLMNTLDTFNRVYTIMLATKINEDVATATWINEGLKVIEQARNGELQPDSDRAFIRVAGQIAKKLAAGSPYRPVTIHRYHPRDELGGIFGMLDFDQPTILGFIERGFHDAIEHDCQTSQCILPN